MKNMNSINLIVPYKHLGMWVFDDSRTGLVREPFVAGADVMIDRVVSDIPNAEQGFIMLFSETPFPGYSIKIDWKRSGDSGNWYYSEQLDMECWLCPALFKYFTEAPDEIFIQVKQNKKQSALSALGRWLVRKGKFKSEVQHPKYQ